MEFWGNVRVMVGTTCWEWKGARTRTGYGRWRHVGQEEYAHRQAWVLTNGPIPAGMVVRHTCDNPPCVKPSHLLLGTAADNAHDRDSRGRRAPTPRALRERHWSKLSEDQVIEIKGLLPSGVRQREIATRYGVSESTIHMIATGRNWQKVRPED